MEEIWKKVDDFSDYEVSNFGRVRSNKHKRCIILNERFTQDGYVQYSLSKNGKAYTKRANRLVAEAFIENPENKPTVNHLDGDKHNNKVDNLEWATKHEQMAHAYKLGLKQPMQGVLQGNSVLTVEEVKEIRKLYKARDKQFGMLALAKKYNVSPSTIKKCATYKSYRNVE